MTIQLPPRESLSNPPPVSEGRTPLRYLSLFSGIEAATVAWKPLGWECVGVAEIEPLPCAILKHYYPNVPNLGDITKITDEQIKVLGHIDLIVGGFPCQDLSVAGLRRGMKQNETRSGLFYDAIRIVWTARKHNGLRWLLLENVPGIYSSRGGEDFASMVNEILGTGFGVPTEGWKNSGVVSGQNGLLEWRTLDAQFFGIPQRRRRMFALADFGDWASRSPVLFERESLLGNITPRREKGEKPAPTISARTENGGGEFDHDGGLIASTLTARYQKGVDSDCTDTLIAQSLRGEGFAGSEVGTGRGTPLVRVAIPIQDKATRYKGGVDSRKDDESANGFGVGQDGDTFSTLGAHDIHAVAFSCKDYGADAGDTAPTLRAMGHAASHANAGGQLAVAFAQNSRDEVREMPYVGALAAEPGMKQTSYIRQAMQVRRITPRECERLQGFPDDYTLIPFRNKPAADGNRYKALGNSMAVPVMRWLGERIELVRHLQRAS